MAALRTYFSATEIAAMGLPGVPTDRKRAREMAQREGWVVRERQGKGRGKEYRLPQWALIHLAMAEKRRAKPAPVARPKPTEDALAIARAVIVGEIRSLTATGSISRNAAVTAIADAYAAGELVVPPHVREAIPAFTVRSATRWLKRADEEGSNGLQDRKRGPRGGTLFDRHPEIHSFVVAQITARPHLKASTLREGLLASGFTPVPSLRYLQQWTKAWRDTNAANLLRVADPDAHRSKYGSAMGSRSAGITRLNQLWEVDGTLFDVMCLTPAGAPVRYSLTAMVDVFSRRAKVLVSRQPSAVAVGLLIRACILDWGLPEAIKADNGKDYTAAYIGRIATDLDIRLDYCTPFNPQEKPHVERFYKTLNHGLAEILPGYVGHNVAERKGIESRRAMASRHGSAISTIEASLSGGELQHVINGWVEDFYHQRPHSALKTTPFLRAMEGGEPLRLRDERALDLLLATSPGKDGLRVVSKAGISVFNRTFIAAELGGVIGERVHVKFDPDDHARIYVYTADRERFLCVASDPTMTDVDQREIAKRAKQAQAQEQSVFRAEMKAAQTAHNPDELAASILSSKAGAASKIVPFVRPASVDAPALTPGFARERHAAAQAASQGAATPPPQPVTEEELETARARFEVYDNAAAPASVFMVTRGDGTQRPGIIDSVEFAGWMRDQADSGPTHPEDAADLRAILAEGGALLRLRLDQAGLTDFVSIVTGDDQ